jgi:hypothetical protein
LEFASDGRAVEFACGVAISIRRGRRRRKDDAASRAGAPVTRLARARTPEGDLTTKGKLGHEEREAPCMVDKHVAEAPARMGREALDEQGANFGREALLGVRCCDYESVQDGRHPPGFRRSPVPSRADEHCHKRSMLA